MSCQCQRKRIFEYEKIRELAAKMAALENKTYYIYAKGRDEYDFAPFEIECKERLRAVEFICPV